MDTLKYYDIQFNYMGRTSKYAGAWANNAEEAIAKARRENPNYATWGNERGQSVVCNSGR